MKIFIAVQCPGGRAKKPPAAEWFSRVPSMIALNGNSATRRTFVGIVFASSVVFRFRRRIEASEPGTAKNLPEGNETGGSPVGTSTVSSKSKRAVFPSASYVARYSSTLRCCVDGCRAKESQPSPTSGTIRSGCRPLQQPTPTHSKSEGKSNRQFLKVCLPIWRS